MTIEQQKRDDLRREVLGQRDKIPVGERQRLSAALIERLWPLPPLAQARLVFTYINFRSEVETLPLVAKCLAAGMMVAAPLTLTDESRLGACQITDPQRELRPGYCQIPEPDPNISPAVQPNDIDVVILPGSAFDEQGGRLGYGGGYYDRFLANDAPQAVRIGVAFEMQIIQGKLPLMPHDKLLHYLVTEKRIIPFRGEKI